MQIADPTLGPFYPLLPGLGKCGEGTAVSQTRRRKAGARTSRIAQSRVLRPIGSIWLAMAGGLGMR
jgi:uncharacterized membrane protein